MLHLKPHNYFHPHISNTSSPVRLSPVPIDDDELIHAIEDPVKDVWQLEAIPDTRELNEFWNGVEDDLKHDPNWFTFASDSDD